MNMEKSSIIKRCLFIAFIVILLGVVAYIIFKYESEGEKTLPYNIEKILIVSTVAGNVNEDSENLWNINLKQNNDIFIYIKEQEKTKNTIKSIKMENFQINKNLSKGNLKLYRPTGELNNLYTYSEQDYFNDSLVYTGSKIDDLKNLEISNIGGVIGFRTSLENLGNYVSNEDTEIAYNGTLLSKVGINLEDIKYNLSFDIIIETSDDVKYKGKIKFDCPAGDIITEGAVNTEITDFSNVIFKRI